jgi:hypothetical protein
MNEQDLGEMDQDPPGENPNGLTPPTASHIYPMRSAETIRVPDHLSSEEVKQFLGSAYFSQNAQLTFQIETATSLLTVDPAVRTLLGRTGESSPDSLFIDLTPYDGRVKGVSRLHAAIHRSETMLTFEDLNSINGTYLNGSRLPPRQPQILHDGDELRLGLLRIRIAFQYG